MRLLQDRPSADVCELQERAGWLHLGGKPERSGRVDSLGHV